MEQAHGLRDAYPEAWQACPKLSGARLNLSVAAPGALFACLTAVQNLS